LAETEFNFGTREKKGIDAQKHEKIIKIKDK
jgi:hypothetical protein